MATYESVRALAAAVAKDPNLESQLKQNPKETLAQLAPVFVSDVWIYRIVVTSLAILIIGVVAVAALLALRDPKVEIPQTITALGSGALGALTGLLAPSPTNK